MRIYAIPILKNRWAYYCHATVSNQSNLNKAVQWSGKKWEEFGKSKADSWKRKIYDRGSHLMNQLDYQEWFLKSIPSKSEIKEPLKNVAVYYPKNLEGSSIKNDIGTLLEKRVPYHRKYMFYSVYWVPLSFTFVVVPLIPNIPLAYNLFRLYSHYSAYQGASHLKSLSKALDFQQDQQLDSILNTISFTSSSDLEFSKSIKHSFRNKDLDMKLLDQDLEGVLNKKDIKLIGEALNTPGIELELYRARSQILKEIALKKFNK